MITENISTLKIHKLTQEQYDRELAAGNIDENALYLTPDSGSDSGDETINGVKSFTDGIIIGDESGYAALTYDHTEGALRISFSEATS